MRRIAALVLVAPLAAGAIAVHSVVEVEADAQATWAALTSGSSGTATIPAHQASATVTMASLPLLTPTDFLRIDCADADWSVHASLVSHTGWTALLPEVETVTISLTNDSLARDQIVISALLGEVQTEGLPVALPTEVDTLVRAVGAGTGQVTFDLVATHSSGKLELRERVTLTVG